MAPATGAVPALCAYFPGAAAVCRQAPVVDSGALCAGSDSVGRADLGAEILGTERAFAVEFEPRALAPLDDLFRLGSGRFVAQLPAGGDSASATTAEVDYARD